MRQVVGPELASVEGGMKWWKGVLIGAGVVAAAFALVVLRAGLLISSHASE